MTEKNQLLSNFVTVDADFKPSVQLPNDFKNLELNERLIRNYIPTSDSIALFTEIAQSLNPNSTERARTLVGTYGTGKSDLLLMICNYLSRPVEDPIMQPFYQRLKTADPVQHNIIFQRRANIPPFLVVLLQSDPDTRFPGFVLHGLNHVLEQQGLLDVMAKTKYEAAREQLENWRQEGHTLFETFCRHLREIEGKEITGLLAELGSPQTDVVFPIFLRVFKKVTGTDFNIYGYSQPHQAFVEVACTLKKRGTHSGILLVCDEFTEYLRRYEHAIDQQSSEIDSETLSVQNVAERCISSGEAQLHFLIASLDSFASASMDSNSGQASKAIERLGGRFKQHSLSVQASEELIKGTIRKPEDIVLLPNRQFDELLDIAMPIWKQQGRSREWVRDTIVNGAFPLHPLTTYALPLINRTVAQSQRTMFQFLKSDEGLIGFIKQEYLETRFSDWNNLLTLDTLFDYFQGSIMTKKPDLADVYNHSLQSLNATNVDTKLAERVLKVITFCEVVAPDQFLSPTRNFLQQALNLPPEAQEELQTALNILEKAEAIYPPETESGIFSLPLTGRVSVVKLRRQVREQSLKLSTSVERLQSQYSPEPIQAKHYNQNRGSHRELKAFYIGVETLQLPTRLKKDLDSSSDAVLWYVVATSDTERATAQSAARELTSANSHLVIAVPVVSLQILSALRDYQALEEVRKDPDIEGTAKAYLQDTGTIGKPYKTNLDQALKYLRDFRQWEWFANGSAHNVQNQQQLYEIASKLMEKLFPYTPSHPLGQHFKPSSPTTSLKKAVENIIKSDIRITTKKTGATDSIIRTCYLSLGVLKFDKTEGSFEVYVTCEPDSKNYASRKVWILLYDNLVDGKTWTHIAAVLRKSPFGLYDSLLLVYLAAFITYYADSIEIANKKAVSGRPNVDIELLLNLLEKPQEYTVRFQPLTDAERQWLRGIVENGIKKRLVSSNVQGKSLRDSVAEQVQQWIKQLKLPIFAEQLTLDTISEIVPDIPQEILSTVLLLINNRKDLVTVLMESIPQKLGTNKDSTQWNEQDVNVLITRFVEVCQILQVFPNTLKLYLENRIAIIFGCENQPLDQRWNTIYNWRQQKQIVNPETLSTETRTLFRLITDPSGSIEQTILNEYAKTIIGINTDYKKWSSLESMTKLEQKIQKALQEIEEKWKESASGEEVWLNGLLSEVSGRPLTNKSTEVVAKNFVDWTQGFSWPSCAQTIQSDHLCQMYQEGEEQQLQDAIYLLQRYHYTVDQWKAEIVETLSKQFGIQSWRKQEVHEALKRFKNAIKYAALFPTLLRKHILKKVATLFADEQDIPLISKHVVVDDVLAQWYVAHPIPEQNDLSEDAQILLHHINPENSNAETVLLSNLPRAFTDIGQSYEQWDTYHMFEQYVDRVQNIVHEINTYEPLTETEYEWLSSIVTQGLQQPLSDTSWEKKRFLSIVAKHFSDWLHDQKLPAFSRTMTKTDLCSLFPEFDGYSITTGEFLLQKLDNSEEQFEVILLITLPFLLGQQKDSKDWSHDDINDLLVRFEEVCRLISLLQKRLANHIYSSIGSIFGVVSNDYTSGNLIAKIRQWREEHVLLPQEELSPNAKALYEELKIAENEPETVLLKRLPRKLHEVRESYDQWQTWQIRNKYITTLRDAAQEIEQLGHVGEATLKVIRFWEDFKRQYNDLSPDEQRWLIKTFNEELRQ